MRLLSTLLVLPMITPLADASERRDADTHVHGASTLMIAIEGESVSLEFEAPAMDLVGFEHAPTTAAQRQRIAEAISALNTPETLFGIPEAAQCTRTQTTVHGPEHENHAAKSGDHAHDKEHAHEKEHSHEKGHDHERDHDQAHHDDETHSAFHAVYTWNCAQIGAMTALNPTIFVRFPGMSVTTVMSATPKGQGVVEVTAQQPRIALP